MEIASQNMDRCPSLLCPVCGKTLRQQQRSFRCPSGHNFDMSRQGYVNLRLAGAGKRRSLGDERDMLAARRRVLDGGYYLPLATAVNHGVLQEGSFEPAANGPLSILDVGCGEGYYLGQLAHYLEQHVDRRAYCLYGMDLSKEAARLAAGRYKGVRFFVADVNERLLFDDGTVDVLLNLFAPRNPVEFRRVLAPGGRLLIVIPGLEHLQELRARYALLDIEEAKEEKLRATLESAFRLLSRRPLRYERRVEGHALPDLVRMTPNYWHLDRAGRAALETTQEQDVRFSFVILQFAPKAEGETAAS